MCSLYAAIDIIWRLAIIFLTVGCDKDLFLLRMPVTIQKFKTVDSLYEKNQQKKNINQMLHLDGLHEKAKQIELQLAKDQEKSKQVEHQQKQQKNRQVKLDTDINDNFADQNDDIFDDLGTEDSETEVYQSRCRYWLKNGCCQQGFFLQILIVFWYILQAVLTKYCISEVADHTIRALLVLPVISYAMLFSDQCRIKLYRIITGFSQAKGPVLLKAMFTIWIGAGILQFINMSILPESKINAMSGNINQNVLTNNSTQFEQIDKYPLCYQQVITNDKRDLMDMVDVTFLGAIVYQNESNIRKGLKLYFKNSTINATLHRYKNDPPTIAHISIQDTQHNDSIQDIIMIRGTNHGQDWLQDFRMYSETLAISAFSGVFPINNVWPEDMLQSFIKVSNSIKNKVLWKQSKNYHEEVSDFINKTAHELKRYKARSGNKEHLVVIGHSLGGVLSHVAAARLKDRHGINVKSYGISSPGLVWNAKKFNVDTSVLNQITTTIVPGLDPVPRVDVQLGNIQSIDCFSRTSESCHSIITTFCEVESTCSNHGMIRNNENEELRNCMCGDGRQNKSTSYCIEKFSSNQNV